MHACMLAFVFMHVFMLLCVNICMDACMDAWMHLCMYLFIYAFKYMHDAFIAIMGIKAVPSGATVRSAFRASGAAARWQSRGTHAEALADRPATIAPLACRRESVKSI